MAQGEELMYSSLCTPPCSRTPVLSSLRLLQLLWLAAGTEASQ